MSRYSTTQTIINNSIEYASTLKSKKLSSILQYSVFDFKNLKNFKDYGLEKIIHTVLPYEKLFNISYKYYSSVEYSWLICYTNGISNELEIETGTKLNIYLPLGNLLRLT